MSDDKHLPPVDSSMPMADVEKNLQLDPAIEPVGADKAIARAQFSYEDGERLKRRADYRLIPLAIAMYLIKNIDGNIVSYVKTMNSGEATNVLKQLHMTTNQWGYVSTVFSVGFVVFEVPSNLFIKKVTPRLHFVRIMTAWSIIVACTAACENAAGMYACRFLLGVAEAGLWSGIIFHITAWYRPDEVATRLAMLTMLGQFSGIIDSLITYGLAFVNPHGLAGWRWSFILCGLLGLVVSAFVFVWLPDFPNSPPSRRQFLTQEEGEFMAARLPPGAASIHDANFDFRAIWEELKSPLLWLFPFINFFCNTGTTGVGFWLSTITKALGLAHGESAQLLNIPPAALFVIFAILTGLWLDRTVRIPKPTALLIGIVGMIGCFLGLMFARSPGGRYALILLAYCFNAMQFVSIWPLRAQTTRGSTSSAFMYAFSNTLSNLPGFYTAQIFQSKYAPYYEVPFGICIAFFGLALITSLLTWWCMRDVERETRRIAGLRRAAGKAEGIVLAEDIAPEVTMKK